ncbi:hypothetical protein F4802DRAFT_205498 [Xylaria palmicola]|nr:hypothetical protein F4802DRAFT_205498 [Xylaria palmicola]
MYVPPSTCPCNPAVLPHSITLLLSLYPASLRLSLLLFRCSRSFSSPSIPPWWRVASISCLPIVALPTYPGYYLRRKTIPKATGTPSHHLLSFH